MGNNIFWNMDKNSQIDKTTEIEHTIKYGDFDDIVKLFKKFDKKELKNIWLNTVATDKRFIKINLMIARVFFDMNIESDYLKGLNSARFKTRLSVK